MRAKAPWTRRTARFAAHGEADFLGERADGTMSAIWPGFGGCAAPRPSTLRRHIRHERGNRPIQLESRGHTAVAAFDGCVCVCCGGGRGRVRGGGEGGGGGGGGGCGCGC
eukprot:12901590-Prorocentrum_lima.AAC.1